MIPPKELSTIAQEYNPDLLNEWLDALIRQYSYALFFSLKDELLEAENHPEWFLKLLNLAHRNQNHFLKYNVNIWNDFIKICKKEDKNFTIDFSGCTFENEEECSFSGIELPNINFYRATFKNKANFGKAVFKDQANFRNTAFEDKVNFGNTTFEDGANFGDTAFKDKANFGNTIFEDEANFGDTAFKDKANFGNTTFEDGAIFEKATFENEANFKKAIFRGEADFENATFQGEAIFQETLFETAFDKKIDFSKAVFKGVTYFTFPTKASNPKTDIYAELSFENATFEKETTFHRRKFFGDTSFIGAEFHFPPAFSMGEEYNPHLLNFTCTKLILSEPPQTLSLRETDIKKENKENKKIDSKPLTRVRNLRKLAGQINEHDFERDLFILERIMNSRINFKSKNFVLRYAQQILIIFYWGLADYSRKAWLPAIWLLYSIVVLKDYLDKYVVKNSECNNYDLWLVSSSNAIPFFNKFSEKSKFILQRCFINSDTVKSMQEIPNMVFVHFTIHGIFSIVMIFLFSLAIRNYFRIK